jgi:hypothetical protein
MGRVAVDFGAGQDASAAPISAAISAKRATPASTESDSNPSGAMQKRRLTASLVRYSPLKGMRRTPSLPFAPSASTRAPFQCFASLLNEKRNDPFYSALIGGVFVREMF